MSNSFSTLSSARLPSYIRPVLSAIALAIL